MASPSPSSADTSAFDYPKRRLEEQQRWHSRKATWNKRRYYACEIVILMAGAGIPVINVLGSNGDVWTRVVSAILGAVVLISTGIAKLFKFQDNWLQFRAVAEGLERENELHAQKVGDYAINDEAKRNGLLVERVEALLTTTTMQFISIHRTKSAEGKGEEPVGK